MPSAPAPPTAGVRILTDILRIAHATGSTPAAAARSRARARHQIEHGRR
ncbi:hypothetical protein ACFY1S_26270 [Micromonospora sp. NPDC000663]